MRILVTNDDGTGSEGLWSLAEALTSVGEVSWLPQTGTGAAFRPR